MGPNPSASDAAWTLALRLVAGTWLPAPDPRNLAPLLTNPLLERTLWGGTAAAAIALAAYRWRALSSDGAWAAVGIGTACAAGGWSWAGGLIAFFVTGSLWSRIGETRKHALTANVVAKGGPRDAVQVAANGGVFALCALAYLFAVHAAGPLPPPPLHSAKLWAASAWRAAGAGALAAATSDTWATEIGTLWGGQPRSILTGRLVPRGTSGGVTPTGTVGGILGSGCLACLFGVLGWGWLSVAAAAGGGIGGMAVDSLLGATVQQRRWCDRCNVQTERDAHGCGALTRVAGGLSWLDNDGVNTLATLAGACIALALFRSLS